MRTESFWLPFRRAIQLLVITVCLSLTIPAGWVGAQGPDEEPISASPELHTQILELGRQVNQIAPYFEMAIPESEQDISPLSPALAGLDGVMLSASFEPRSEVDFSPLPLYPAPALAPTSEEDLRRLGAPTDSSQVVITPADLSDPFNPINSTASYSLLSGHTASEGGWLLFSSGRRPRYCWDCSASHYTSNFTGSKTASTPAEIMNNARNVLNAFYNDPRYAPLLARNGGDGNQFRGQLPHPGGWNVNSQNPFYAGPSSATSNTPFSLLALLGYNRDQINAHRTLLQLTLSRLSSPWLRTRTSWNLFGLQAASTGVSSTQSGTSLEQRYLKLAEQQLTLYHRDTNLSNLRIEAHRVYLFYMFYDPYYLYLDYALKAYLQTIYTSRPSYPTLYNQALLVRSRTSPPTNLQTLRQHYYDRLLLEYYKSLVEYETAWYLHTTPNAQNTVRAYTLAMSSRLGQLWSTPTINNWFANWRSRWLNNYQASPHFKGLDQEIRNLNRDYPALAEYTRLNKEVVQLLPSFEKLPAVEAVTDQLDTALTNQNVANKVSQHYNSYNNQLNSTLNRTNFAPKIERYNQQLNGLFAKDTTYQQVAQLENDTLLLLLQFQYSVYQAVLECYNFLGNSCNPNSYPKVLQIYSQQASDGTPLATALTNVTGSFHEVYNLFWYQFYHGSAYTNLEQNTMQGLNSELTPISTQIDKAQQQFQQNVSNIPEVAQLQSRIDNAAVIMLGQSQLTGLSAAESAELQQASTELRQKLQRMAQLALILEGEQIYLPIVAKR